MSEEIEKKDADNPKQPGGPPGVLKRHGKKITWSSIATVFVGGLSTGAVDMYSKWRELKLESAANSEELRPAILELQTTTIPKLVNSFTGKIAVLENTQNDLKARLRIAEDRLLVYETYSKVKDPRRFGSVSDVVSQKVEQPETKEEPKSPVVKMIERAQEVQEQQQQMQEYLPKEKVHKDMKGAKEALKDRRDL